LKKTYRILEKPNSLFYLKGDLEIPEMVMHTGLSQFEEKSVEIITQNGGDILEIGFGMGISANSIISKNISSYTCVEINDYIFQNAQSWSNGKNNVSIIQDSWENFLITTTNKYDAVYCDFMNWEEYEEFYEKSKNVLKTNGIISTYGAGIYFGDSNMNIVEDIPAPSIHDSDFTYEISDRLINRNFYKVYWQYFDGTSYVKTLS
jgi:16S rRNA G966 N2-methylase RsmD